MIKILKQTKERIEIWDKIIKNSKEELDKIDLSIISELQKDGRKTYQKIADEIGISVGTIHNRISHLKKIGIINGFMIKINNEKLGFNFCILISIQINNKYKDRILLNLRDRIEVTSCFYILESQTIFLICYFRNLKHIQEFIKDLREEEYILQINSNLILMEYKNQLDISL